MKNHWRLLVTCIFYTIFGGSCNFQSINLINTEVKSFINVSIYNNYHKTITLNQLEWYYSVLSAITFVGYSISCLFLSYLMEKFGRKGGTVFIKNPIVIIGALLSFGAVYCDRFELLFIGRFLNGFAMPMTVFDNIFLTECAPVRARAFVGILPTIGLRCLTVLGMAMGLSQILGTADRWNFMFLFSALFAAIHFIIGSFVQESPRHLYITLNNEIKARRSIIFYHGEQAEIDQIIAGYEEEVQRIQAEGKAGLIKILKTKYLRWPLVLYAAICLSSTFNGAHLEHMYSKTTLSSVVSAKAAALYTILLIEVPSLLAMSVASVCIANKGRRPVLLAGVAVSTIGAGLVAASSVSGSVRFFAIIGLILTRLGQSIGYALVRRFITAELCPQISRSKTVSSVNFLAAITNFTSLSTYTPLLHHFGTSIMAFYTGCSVLCFVFLFKYFPETRNRSVTENISQWLPMDNVDENTPLVSRRELQ